MKPTKSPTVMAARQARTAGFSLIELMVALTIGLFISLALSAVFVNSKTAFTAQDQLAQLQDNERLALLLLTSSVELAGYYTDPINNAVDTVFPADASAQAYGQFVQAVGITGASGTAEFLATRYVTAGGDGQSSCLGDTAAGSYVNVFSISANNELQCAVNGGTPVALVGGVAAFRVAYGVDTTSGGSATRYLTAAAVTGAGAWANVKTVQISIDFVNPYKGQGDQPDAITWVQTVKLMNSRAS